MEPFVFRATRKQEHLGLWPDDEIVVEPGHPSPVVLTRRLPPNYGAILGAFGTGALELISGNQSLDQLAAVVGLPPSLPLSGHAQKHRALGWRLRRARMEVLR